MKKEVIKYTTRNIVRTIVFTPVAMYLIFCMYLFICEMIESKTMYVDCGKIVSKSSVDNPIKRGMVTTLYLNIQYDIRGFYSTPVEPTTYFSKKIGDRCCFELQKKDIPFWYKLSIPIGMTSFTILIVILVVLLGKYLIGC